MRVVALDFETTGVVNGWPNEPWQLGLVEIIDGKVVPESKWETYFNVGERPFSPRAVGRWQELHDELAASPTFFEAWPEISSRLCGVPLVAHNASTERTVLTKAAPLTPWGPWIDTLKITRKYWPLLKSYKLGDIISAFGLKGDVDSVCPNRIWHDALYDAVAGACLFSHILKYSPNLV